VIQRVEGLGTEFAVDALPHLENLKEPKVPLVLIGTADAVEAQRHIADVGSQLFCRVGFEAGGGGRSEPMVNAARVLVQDDIVQVAIENAVAEAERCAALVLIERR